MSIASEIQRLRNVRQQIYNAIDQKGGITHEDVGKPMRLEQMPRLIGQIPSRQPGAALSFPDDGYHPYNITFSGEYVPTELALSPTEYWESVTIQDGAKVIGECAFEGCQALTEVFLADSITEIGGRAFANCGLLVLEKLPRELKIIGRQAFYSCYELKTITFQGTPEEVAEDAFEYCDSLANIRVPWSEGEVPGAPWGAEYATVEYNVQPET